MLFCIFILQNSPQCTVLKHNEWNSLNNLRCQAFDAPWFLWSFWTKVSCTGKYDYFWWNVYLKNCYCYCVAALSPLWVLGSQQCPSLVREGSPARVPSPHCELFTSPTTYSVWLTSVIQPKWSHWRNVCWSTINMTTILSIVWRSLTASTTLNLLVSG